MRTLAEALPAAVGHFFRERGTHLAAMVAYFALASFVPLIFLALAGLGLFGQVDASSALVSYLDGVFPGQTVDEIVTLVRTVQRNARTLTVVGVVGLLWSSLSLFSALESAFNIVYGKPNRSFLHGKAVALIYMSGSLVVLFTGLIAGTFGYDLLRRAAPSIFGNGAVALTLTLLVSALAVSVFLFTAYFRLTNVQLNWRDVLPGTIAGTLLLVVTLQALPLFVYVAGDVVALQALGTTFLLLVWLYVMANVIVFGSALNYELAKSRVRRAASVDEHSVYGTQPS